MEMDEESSNTSDLLLEGPTPPPVKGRPNSRRLIEPSPPQAKGRGRGRGVRRGSGTDISLARLDLLCNVAADIQRNEEEMLIDVDPLPDEDDDDIPEGGLFKKCIEEGTLKTLTNFEEIIILDIYHTLQPIYSNSRGRGVQPKLSLLDSLFIILILYKNALHLNALAAVLHIRFTTLRDTITRIRPLLTQALEARWINKQRPQVLEGILPHAAIAVDSTSFEVYRPHGRFEEAKIYFDAKNKIYALKKEVAVKLKPPNYALFYHKATYIC